MNKKLLQLAKLVSKLAEIRTDKGLLIIGDDLAQGVEVTIEKDGDFVVPEDGEYIYEDKKIIIKDGIVAEVLEMEEPKEEIAEMIEEVEAKKQCMEEMPEAEVPQEPVKDEKDLRIEELEGLIQDRDAVIEELTAKIKEMEDKIAKPVEEPVQMNKVIKEKNNENKALKYFE